MTSIYRYERKFVFNSSQYDYIINRIEINGWSRLFPERKINNIYLDSIGKQSIHD